VTLALALLAGGVTALLQLAVGALGPAGTPVLLGVVLAVLGAGLVVGSFLRAGRGLVPVAVVVGLITWGSLSTPWTSSPAAGSATWTSRRRRPRSWSRCTRAPSATSTPT
jgi:hypothetical protein